MNKGDQHHLRVAQLCHDWASCSVNDGGGEVPAQLSKFMFGLSRLDADSIDLDLGVLPTHDPDSSILLFTTQVASEIKIGVTVSAHPLNPSWLFNETFSGPCGILV